MSHLNPFTAAKTLSAFVKELQARGISTESPEALASALDQLGEKAEASAREGFQAQLSEKDTQISAASEKITALEKDLAGLRASALTTMGKLSPDPAPGASSEDFEAGSAKSANASPLDRLASAIKLP